MAVTAVTFLPIAGRFARARARECRAASGVPRRSARVHVGSKLMIAGRLPVRCAKATPFPLRRRFNRNHWEQGAHRPDRAAQVLFTVIAKDPDAVARALKS
jgi:hypothetical protein